MLITSIAFTQTNYSPLYNSSNFVKTIDLARPVGAIEGEAGTTPIGASSYTIPIYAPPGTNGVAPSVSLVYSSQAGSGIAGYGWSISGLSAISRTGKNLYHNDKVSTVEYNWNDTYLLDGMRLNAIDGNNSADGTIYATENEVYSKIVSYTGTGTLANPGWFWVFSKDGSQMEFGHTTDSRVLSDDGINVMLWRLNRIIDVNGNYIDFKYDNGNRDSRIDEIIYTGNVNTGLLPYNKIKFTYGSRQDMNTGYDAGYSLNSNFLLNKITVTHTNDNLIEETVKTYNLKYGFDNIHSLLKEIEECGAIIPPAPLPIEKSERGGPPAPQECLNSTIFLYGDQPENTVVETVPQLNGEYSYYSGDFDADGKSDIMAVRSYYNNTMQMRIDTAYKVLHGTNINTILYSKSLPQGTSTELTDKKFYNFLTSDYNKDGRDDVIETNISWDATRQKRSLNYITINYSTTTGYTPGNFPVPNGDYKYLYQNGNFFIPGDFDGDGNQDYILMLAKWLGGSQFEYKAFLTRPSAGEINIPVIGLGDGMPTMPDEGVAGVAAAALITPIDMDGDGKMEILVTTNPTYVYSSSFLFQVVKIGSSYTAYYDNIYSPTSEVVKNCKVYPGDFNGDRRTDLLVRNTDGSWKVLTSNGYSFISNPFYFNQAVIMSGNYNHKVVVSDFNGDGKSDILHGISDGFTYSSSYSVYYSKGLNSWYNELYPYNKPISSFQFTVTNGFIQGDFNGDGRTDLFNLISNSTPYDIITVKPNGKERLLQKVTNGQNVTTAFEYKILTDKTTWPYVYNRTISLDDPQNQAPFNYVQIPMPVVSSLIVPDGTGGNNITNYFYEDAVVHRYAKGFLGFKKITTQNNKSFITSVTETNINTQFAVPYVVKQTTKLTNDTENISETIINNSFTNLSTGSHDIRYLQKVDKTVQVDNLNGTAAETASTFDSYGNVTTSISKKGYFTSGTNVITPVETATTNTTYGWYNTPVPAHPVSVTATVIRTGQPAQSVTSVFAYNTIGTLASKTEFYGLPKAVTTSFSYNSFGNVIQTTIAATGINNRVANAIYDVKGRYPLTKEAVGGIKKQTEVFTYDSKWGQPLTKTNIECLTTGYEYDAFGRMKKTNLPEGYAVTSTLHWDIQGEQLFYSFTDFPGGKPDSKTWVDKLGRELKTQTAGFNNQWLTQLNTYNNKGQLLTKTNAYYPGETPIITTNYYDIYGRPASVINPLSTISYNYETLNEGKNKVTVQNSAGQSSSKTTDAAGKTVEATDNGGTLQFVYDSRGNQVETKHGSISMVSSEYDVYGRQTKLTDRNAGVIEYQYDAFGQLVYQKDAIGNDYTMTYDDFGRITGRQGPEGNTTYEYYFKGGFCLNKLRKVTGFNGVTKEYTYDALKRPLNEKVTVDGTAFETQFGYDSYSNLISTTYPSGLVVNNTYDINGNLLTVTSGDTWNPVTLFTANAVNGFGQYTNYTLGNGKTSQLTYTYGIPTRLYTPGVQDMQYSFDFTKGNLNSRYDALKNLTETFQYDNLDRLTTSTVNGVQQLSINYDGNSSSSLGNIVSKTDAGNYVYKNDKIHAVAFITNPAGPTAPPVTMLPSPDQLIGYTSFLKADSISDGSVLTTIGYGPDYQRIKSEVFINGSINTTKYFIGNMERVTNYGYTRDIHYIPVGNSIAIIEKPLNWNSTIHFVYTDYLGSLLTRTDINGVVTAEQNFDAWGRQRNPVNWQFQNYSFISSEFFDRGFTGHEHLPYHGLINMNGRMYEPVQGRMLSPDNYISNPFTTQAYNRYGYANNNPLKFTDPDGNFPWLIVGIAALAFGTGNTVSHAIKGDVKNFGDGLKYFFQGAVVGAAVASGVALGLGVPILKTIIIGAGSIHAGTTALSVVSGLANGIFNGDWSRLGNAGKLFIGNFYLDENKSFFGGVFEGISRHSWQLIQQTIGHGTAQIYNTVGDGKAVSYYGGATALETFSGGWGAITQGSFVVGSRGLNADPSNELFQHEYGHYLQSQLFGPLYYGKAGIPSAFSHPPHDLNPVEQDANGRAFKYFNKKIAGYSGWEFTENPILDLNFRLKFNWYDPIDIFGIINSIRLNRQY